MRVLAVTDDKGVAPHTGAWIETTGIIPKQLTAMSHPTRVRGLKLELDRKRILIIKSHPTRVRGLKLFVGACLL